MTSFRTPRVMPHVVAHSVAHGMAQLASNAARCCDVCPCVCHPCVTCGSIWFRVSCVTRPRIWRLGRRVTPHVTPREMPREGMWCALLRKHAARHRSEILAVKDAARTEDREETAFSKKLYGLKQPFGDATRHEFMQRVAFQGAQEDSCYLLAV